MRNFLLLSFIVGAGLPVHAQNNSVPIFPGQEIRTISCRFIGRPISPRAKAVSAYSDAKFKFRMAESLLAIFSNPVLESTPEKIAELRADLGKAAAQRDMARADAISLGGMRDVDAKDEDNACSLIRGIDYSMVGTR